MLERAPDPPPHRPLSLLIACQEVVLGGGYLRFERMGEVLRAWGHEVAWLCRPEPPSPQFSTRMPIHTLATARAHPWDAVMIPGGEFDADTLAWFSALRDRHFGVRVQHVLNERRVSERFEVVNAPFAPDVVVFNNVDWPVELYARLPASAHHVLVGAVDAAVFRPRPYRTHPLKAGRWVIGGQSRKNPELLIAALDQLPETVCLRLFGPDHHGLAAAYPHLVAAGRLDLVGPLTGEAMARFYDDVDCIVMAETLAGWANFVAEAMASGVPVVCTPHGTWSLARDEVTALLMDVPTADAIATHVRRLMADAALCQRLAVGGREVAMGYSWDAYARELLAVIGRAAAGVAPQVPAPADVAQARRDRGLAAVVADAQATAGQARARAAEAEAQLEATQAQLEATQARLAAREAELAEVLSSTAWRLTGPMRRLVQGVGLRPRRPR